MKQRESLVCIVLIQGIPLNVFHLSAHFLSAVGKLVAA